MKHSINVRLDNNIVSILDNLSKELNTTKTDIIEKAVELFSKQNKLVKNDLLKYAGVLKEDEAQAMIENIKLDKNSKEFSMDF